MAIDEAPPPAQTADSDAQTAAALAQQVEASADGVTWRKTTTLLDLFGVYRLTTEVRERIAVALEQAGLAAKPSIADVQRFETVRLALDTDRDGQPDEDERSRTPSRLLPVDEVIEVTEWRPGQEPERKGVFQCTPSQAVVRWFHVDVIHSEPDMIFEVLEPVCPGLTLQMVK